MEEVKDVVAEALSRAATELPSASEVGEDMAEKDEEVEMMLEAPTSPLLKSCLVVVKKIKTEEHWVPPREV